jgi:signal transduction histidine kinase
VRLAFDRQQVRVIVADDGGGMQRPAAVTGLRAPQGLVSMQERCELIGGRLTVRSAPGRGTVVHAKL